MRDDRARIRSSSATLTARSSPVNEVVPADQEDAVREAVHSCPEQAIVDRRREHQPTNVKGDSALSVDDVAPPTSDRKKNPYHFDRHTPEYRVQFEKITEEMQAKCPMAWTDVYDGHWVAADSKEVFELARCPVVSNDHDINGERNGLPGHHHSRRRSAPRSCAAASWRWTSPSTAPTAVR